MSDTHSMEIEIEFCAECEFEIEPYNPGGREEAPSGGCASLYSVKYNGIEIDSKLWPMIGLDAKKVKEIEEQAWEQACEAEQDAKEARGDDKYHEMKDEGRI